MKTFAERVKAQRKQAGLNQQQLAKISGLSQTTISDIERARNEGSRDVVRLAHALKVSAEWLITGLGKKDIEAHVATESELLAVSDLPNSKQTRRTNMQLLIEKEQSKAAFARKVGTDPAYVSQILSDKTRAEIGDTFARKIEKAYNLPHGWMDNVQAQNKSESAGTELIESVSARLDYLGWNWGDLARLMGMAEQRVNNWRNRGIPARELRKVEAALKLPRYALDFDHALQLEQHTVEHIELLEAWAYLLPTEKEAMMEQIRPMAAHNKAVLEQIQKP